MLEQLIDWTDTLIGTQLQWFRKSQNVILTSLICVMSVFSAMRVVRDGRKIGGAVRRDVTVRILWYTAIVLCSLATTWLSSRPRESVYQWINDLRFLYPFWMLNVLLASLICRAGFAIRLSDGGKFQWLAKPVMTFASLVLLCALVADVTLIPGLISIAIVSMEIGMPHVFGGFTIQPNGASVHSAAAEILLVACFSAAMFGICLFCSVIYWRHPSRRRFLWVIVTTSIFVTSVWYLDSDSAAKLSATLEGFLFSKNPSRVVAAFVFVLPIASIAGRSVTKKAANVRSCNVELETDWLCWFERATFAILFAHICLNFYSQLHNALKWAVRHDGIFSLMYMLTPIQVVGTAVGGLSAAYAFGRAVDMRWSQRIGYPTEYIEDLSISGALSNTLLIAVQMIGSSVLLAWVVLVFGYLPLP